MDCMNGVTQHCQAPQMTTAFAIWASDSDFCLGIVDECNPQVLTLTIDNEEQKPLLQLSEPVDGNSYVTASENSLISGSRTRTLTVR